MRSCPEAVCGGVGRDKSVLQTGTTRSREVSARIGVTSDEAENAPRLRVANGEDSQESKPPVKRRVKTHTASAQDNSAPVPWRWGSRTGNRRLQGTSPQPVCPAQRGDLPAWFSLGAHIPLPEPLPCLTGCSPSFFPAPALRPLAHHSCYPLSLFYPCTDAAVAVGTLPDVFSTTSSPNWRAFRLNALICFSFICASYSS